MYPYQQQAVDSILRMNGRALIAHEPGLGKTRIACAALQHYGGKQLVVAPAALRVNWQREIKQWNDQVAHIIDDDVNPFGSLCIVSYEMLRRHDKLRSAKWDCIVVDESHRMKSIDAMITKLLLPMLFAAPYVLLMSGTPQMSRTEELFSQLHAVSKGKFGTYYEFTSKFCNGKRGRFGWECTGSSNLDELREKMALYVLRETKESVLSLPPKHRHAVYLELDEESTKLLKEMRVQLNVLRERARKGTKWHKQEAEAYFMECWRTTSTIKAPLVCTWLRTFMQTHADPIALFPHHHVLMSAIETEFTDKNVVRIDGATSKPKRQEYIDTLKRGAVDIGILSLTACGAGLTLCPGVHTIVLPELPMTPAACFQAEDRSHRIGAVKEVHVYYLIARGSIDEDIFRMLERKSALSASVMDDAETSFLFEE